MITISKRVENPFNVIEYLNLDCPRNLIPDPTGLETNIPTHKHIGFVGGPMLEDG